MLEILLIKHLLFQVPLGQSLLSLDMELRYYYIHFKTNFAITILQIYVRVREIT